MIPRTLSEHELAELIIQFPALLTPELQTEYHAILTHDLDVQRAVLLADKLITCMPHTQLWCLVARLLLTVSALRQYTADHEMN